MNEVERNEAIEALRAAVKQVQLAQTKLGDTEGREIGAVIAAQLAEKALHSAVAVLVRY